MAEESEKAQAGVRMPSFVTHSTFIEPLLYARICVRPGDQWMVVGGRRVNNRCGLCSEDRVEQCVVGMTRGDSLIGARWGGPIPTQYVSSGT